MYLPSITTENYAVRKKRLVGIIGKYKRQQKVLTKHDPLQTVEAESTGVSPPTAWVTNNHVRIIFVITRKYIAYYS